MKSDQNFGGDWTSDKLERLCKYLRAYTTIMNKQSSKYNLRYGYIDAFAGTGYRELKVAEDSDLLLFPDLIETVPQFLDGSAIIAMKCRPEFQYYIFIEQSQSKLDKLKERLKNKFPDKDDRIIYLCGDSNVHLENLCSKNWNRHRAVLFLDPFGMQVKWSTLQAIAKTEAIDLWLLFPWGVAVNRLLTRDGHINYKWKNKLNEIFGEEAWYDVFYNKQPELTLFGDDEQLLKNAETEDIKNYTLGRLKTIFPHVAPNPLVLYNSKMNPLYILFFAAANPKGGKTAIKIAEYILGKDRHGQ